MGGTRWDEATAVAYNSIMHDRTVGTRAAFTHTMDIRQGRVAAHTHPDLDPKGVGMRESRDSDAHPAATAVMVFLDVTGSMGRVPPILQSRLGALMTLLQDRGYLTDPAILIGAVGDAISDAGPLQVGQFESGIEIDHDLERLWIEGGGGGSMQESYELAHYFAARHTATDCWERRQQKGYLFTVGDEAPYPAVSRRAVAQVFGDVLQGDIPTREIVAQAQERWHVFHLHAQQGAYRGNPQVLQQWRDLLGPEHVILLEDASHVSEVIALVVGLNEGRVSLEDARQHLTQVGLSDDAAQALARNVEALAARAIRLREEVAP